MYLASNYLLSEYLVNSLEIHKKVLFQILHHCCALLEKRKPHLLIYTYYSRLLAYREVADYGSNGPLQAHISNVRVFHFFAKLFFFSFWTQNLLFDICSCNNILITSSIEYIPSLYDFVNKFYGTISIYYLLWFMKPIYIFVPPSWWHVLQYKEHSDKTKLRAHFGKLSS